MNSKFDEIVNRAIKEHGKLEVKFIRVTDGGERTVEYSTYADFDYEYRVSKIIGQETLVKIEKITHDRVFSKDIKYVGAYFIFPEKIVEDNVEASNTYDPIKCHTAENGEKWHVRSLYVQQILEIRYNGTPVFKNSGVFDFSIIGDDGKEYRTVPYSEIKKQEAQIEAEEAKEMQSEAERALIKKRAAEIYPTLSRAEACQHLGWVNGWLNDIESVARRRAIRQKHHELCVKEPGKHEWYNAESESAQRRGFNNWCCTCGYGVAVDSSD